MNTETKNLKQTLIDFTEIVNGFKSEAVQLKVIECVLATIHPKGHIIDYRAILSHEKNHYPFSSANLIEQPECQQHAPPRKPIGATKLIRKLFRTEFFNEPHNILEITNQLIATSPENVDIKTSEVSGILLKFYNEKQLIRETGENGRFTYRGTTKIELPSPPDIIQTFDRVMNASNPLFGHSKSYK